LVSKQTKPKSAQHERKRTPQILIIKIENIGDVENPEEHTEHGRKIRGRAELSVRYYCLLRPQEAKKN